MSSNQTDLQPVKRPCKVITLQEKLAILEQLRAGTSRRDVEIMFKCSQSTISRVLSGKQNLIQEAESNVPNRRDSLLSYKELDQALSQWAKEMIMSEKLITSNMAKQKADEFCLAMGYDFRPSNGWLYKWKERENIKFAKRTKDPEEILKEFLDKRGKSDEIIGINEKNSNKKTKLEGTQQGLSETVEEKTQEGESIQNESPSQNTTEGDNKPRSKREYVKRLPILDASGLVFRSRKEKTFLTLLQKLEILQRLKNGERRSDLIVEYKLSHSAMSQIVTDEEKILKLAAGGQNLQMKRIRLGIFKGGEAELNAWVKEKMESGENLTRTQIKNKAKEIAERLNIDFKASTGWLEKWKARMNLDFNENQILQRKVPNYTNVAPEEEFDSCHGNFEQLESFYDHSEGDFLTSQIKEEHMNNAFGDEMDTSEEYICDDINNTDVKPEILTPQQFYQQTLKADTQSAKSSNGCHKESNQREDEEQQHQLEAQEQSDIKPYIGTPPHIIPNEETNRPPRTLHEQVLEWFNRYHISPVAASELLAIIQPHLQNPATHKQQYF